MDLEQLVAIAETILEDNPSEKILASSVETVIREYLGREGFARKTLQKHDIKKGEISKVKIRRKDVSFAGGTVRQSYLYPPEFVLSGCISIPDIEASLDSVILAEKIVDLLESSLIKEDLVWKKLVSQGVTFSGSPSEAVADLKANGIEPAWWIAGSGFLARLALDVDLDPLSKRQLVENGTLPKIFGANIHTDVYRDPHLRVLKESDAYLVGAPINFGVRTVRKDFSLEIGSHPEGKAETIMAYTMIEGMSINKLAVRKLV